MEITIRNAHENDYNQVEAIMEQVQAMHTTWRTDIYKNVDVVLPFDMYMDHVTKNELIVAMTEDEPYRGQGIGHKLFNYVKNICVEQNYDGLELQVNAKNTAAKRMYEKYGFTEKSIKMVADGIHGGAEEYHKEALNSAKKCLDVFEKVIKNVTIRND